jgi:hypothetical protein
VDRTAYEDYVAAFNGRDYDRLGSYYADDVEFVLSEERGLVFHGRQAILDLYRPFHRAVEELVERHLPPDPGADPIGDRPAARPAPQGHVIRVLRPRP